jgi:CrcB protein
MQLLWIMLGGAVGTGARYLVNLGAAQMFGPRFPWGTLIVNLLGSFLIGAIMELSFTTAWINPAMRMTLVTGVLGGFTTYSSFNNETLTLLRTGSWTTAAVNLTVTVVGCLLAGMLGIAAAKAMA